MSFEGYEEYICPKGHYFAKDTWYHGDRECPYCKESASYYHLVDQTNGEEEMEDGSIHPATREAHKELLPMWEDVWRTDHYGNKYAVKINLYRPNEPDVWQVLDNNNVIESKE